MPRQGETLEQAIARLYAERYGGEIIRARDGFVLVYRRVCGDNGCKRVIVWFRKSPINEKTIAYLQRVLSRMGWDEVWLVKLYKEPDYTEDYKKIVGKEYYWRDIL